MDKPVTAGAQQDEIRRSVVAVSSQLSMMTRAVRAVQRDATVHARLVITSINERTDDSSRLTHEAPAAPYIAPSPRLID